MPPRFGLGLQASLVTLEGQFSYIRQQTNILNTSYTNINRSVTNIDRSINRLERIDTSEIESKLDTLISDLQTAARNIRVVNIKITDLPIEFRRRFSSIDGKLEQISGDVQEIQAGIEVLNDVLRSLENNLERKIFALSVTLRSGIALLQGLLEANTAATIAARAAIIGEITTVIAEVARVLIVCNRTRAEVSALRDWIRIQCQQVINQIKSKIDSTEAALNNKLDNIESMITDLKDTLPEEIYKQVGLHVVGQSYYSWDSTCQYYPTITFLFAEDVLVPPQGHSPFKRRSQIKLRLRQTNQSITDNDILNLKPLKKNLIKYYLLLIKYILKDFF